MEVPTSTSQTDGQTERRLAIAISRSASHRVVKTVSGCFIVLFEFYFRDVRTNGRVIGTVLRPSVVVCRRL